jgi:CheY-like chemotaxis protein
VTTAAAATRTVLLVDDDPADVAAIGAALAAQPVLDLLQVAWDAEQALAVLEAGTDGQRAADLILLDLRLPTQSGAQLLEALKTDPRLGASRWWCPPARRPRRTCATPTSTTPTPT